jgi:hypothetical protein
MLKEKNSLLELISKKEQSIINQIMKKILESLYELFDLILDNAIENIVFEVLNLFISYAQIIMFIFNEAVRNIYANKHNL